jgi:hypothetical protein
VEARSSLAAFLLDGESLLPQTLELFFCAFAPAHETFMCVYLDFINDSHLNGQRWAIRFLAHYHVHNILHISLVIGPNLESVRGKPLPLTVNLLLTAYCLSSSLSPLALSASALVYRLPR